MIPLWGGYWWVMGGNGWLWVVMGGYPQLALQVTKAVFWGGQGGSVLVMSGSGLVIGCFGWLWGGYWLVMGVYGLVMGGFGYIILKPSHKSD